MTSTGGNVVVVLVSPPVGVELWAGLELWENAMVEQLKAQKTAAATYLM
jgi:hypothetical protein